MTRPRPWPTPDSDNWNTNAEVNWDYAIDTADAALAMARANTAGGLPGVVTLDSFPGSTDDAKLDGYWALCLSASTTRRPACLFPARDLFFNKSRVTFSGMRLLFPGRDMGWLNPEISGSNGSFVNHRVTLGSAITNGANSWLVGTTTTYDTALIGAVIVGHANVQVYDHPIAAGTCYAGHFADLTFMNCKHAFGRPAEPMSITLTTMDGILTNVGVADTQYSFRGSDNWLTPTAMNYGWAGANAGKYLARFSNLSKSWVKNWYLTARGGSRAILVEGPANQQGGLFIQDCVIEGQNYQDPAMGALIRQTGGNAFYQNMALNFGMFRPSDFTDVADTALIMVDGGVAVVDSISTCRASGVAETVPIVETTNRTSSGGTATAYVGKVIAMPANGQGWTGGKARTKQTAGVLNLLDSSAIAA